MSNILKLKKNKSKTLETVKAQTEAMTAKKSYKDERYWLPLLDKAGSGFAIIRFLPGIAIAGTEDDYEQPYVRKWTHGFQGPSNLWYIENNRNTLTGGDNTGEGRDPVTEYNSKLWKLSKAKDDEFQQQARAQKRKLSYVSNIYVVKHPARPEDEGKVFLYQYGQKIFDKINAKVAPTAEDMAADSDLREINVFDFWDGCNFRLKVKKVAGWPNYDDSSFDPPKPLAADAELEAIFKQEHSLLAEVAPDKFKTYDELKKRLYQVLDLDLDDEEEVTVKASAKPKATAAVAGIADEDEEPPFDVDEETGEVTEQAKPSSTSDFFKKLKASKG